MLEGLPHRTNRPFGWKPVWASGPMTASINGLVCLLLRVPRLQLVQSGTNPPKHAFVGDAQFRDKAYLPITKLNTANHCVSH